MIALCLSVEICTLYFVYFVEVEYFFYFLEKKNQIVAQSLNYPEFENMLLGNNLCTVF